MKTDFIYPEIASLMEAKGDVERLLKETAETDQDAKDHLSLLDTRSEWLQWEIDQLKKRWLWLWIAESGLAAALSALGLWIYLK